MSKGKQVKALPTPELNQPLSLELIGKAKIGRAHV